MKTCKRCYKEYLPGVGCSCRKTAKEKAPARRSAAACSASSLARRFHDAYERLAPQFGYETRLDTKVYDPDTPNGRLMAAVCVEVMNEYTEQLREIAEMPEYDQDDAHRLRHKAHRFLSLNANCPDAGEKGKANE